MRDENFKVVVERKLYDSQLNNKLDADYDAGFGVSFLSMMNGLKAPAEYSQDTYAWASKLGTMYNYNIFKVVFLLISIMNE